MDGEAKKPTLQSLLPALVTLGVAGAVCGGIYFAQVTAAKRITTIVVQGEVPPPATDATATSFTAEQIALLIAKSPGVKDATRLGAVPSNFEDVFSPRLVEKLRPEQAFILPPVLDVVPVAPAADAPPPEDLRRVFRETFALDGLASNGAFFNQRFIAVGGLIFAGKAPGREAEIKAFLTKVDKQGADVTVNGDAIRIDFKRPGAASTPEDRA